MASEFKELNNQFIKRPAVTLFKKPLVTNDEMTNILEGLLDIDAELEQKSVREYSCGNYKAVYWNHLNKKPIYDNYNSAVVFYHSYSPEDITPFLDPNIALNTAKEEFTKAAAVWGENSYFPQLVYDNTLKRELSKQIPKARELYRTYTLWIIDPLFTAPDNDSEVIKSKRAEEFWYPLNENLFVSKTLRPFTDKDEFEDTEEGKNILKEIKKRGITKDQIRKYIFQVKEGVYYKTLSLKDLRSALQQFRNNEVAKKWFSNSQLIENYGYFIFNKLGESRIKTPIYKKDAGGQYIPLFPIRTYNPPVYMAGVSTSKYTQYYMDIPIDKFFQVDSFLTSKNNYLKFGYTENPHLQNIIQPWDSVFTVPSLSNKLCQFTYDPKKLVLTVHQDSYTGSDKFKGITIEEVINAYIHIANEINELLNKVPKTTETSQLFSVLGYDTPLRTAKEAEAYFMNNITGYVQQIVTSRVLLNLLRVVSGATVKSSTRTSVSHSIKEKDIPTIFDFKLKYYSQIYNTYIRPKYLKYATFIKEGLMKVYPQNLMDLFEYTLPYALEKGTSNAYKLSVINNFESVVFNKLNGFYITSTTEIPETLAPYSNTVIMDDNVDPTADAMLSVLNSMSASKDSNLAGINNITNKDVSAISVSRQSRGKSSTSVVLKNLNNKYTISEGTFSGEVILEPMDEILVYFPTFDEKLVLAFKGLIDSVQVINNKGYNSIGIQASCPIKRLELTRTNVKPSLSAAENLNSEIHPFTVPKDFFNNVSKWAPFMFMQALTFYSSQLKPSTIEDATTKIYKLDAIRLPEFKDTLLKYLWYKKTNAETSQDKAAASLQELIDLYTSSVVQASGDTANKDSETPGIKDPYSVVKGSFKEGNGNLKVYYNVYAQRSDSSNSYRDLEAQILGTCQPGWVLGQQDISIIFSDYKTNYDILSETAEKFNFYLYSNRNGIIQYRSPQIDLFNLNITTDNGKTLFSPTRMKNEKDRLYEMRPDVLNAQTTTSLQAQCDDSKLITWLQISGENIWGGLNADAGNAVVVQDLPKSLKYGIKSQQTQLLSGVQRVEALTIYALSLMDRQNSLFRSARVTGLASGDLDINTTVYSPVDNTVYLIDGINLDYTPGQTFTYSASLKWGRKPLFKVPLKKVSTENQDWRTFKGNTILEALITDNTTIDLKALSDQLLQCAKNNEITPAYYHQLKSYLDYMRDNPDDSRLLASFIFNGYVWDGVSSISFEDLILSYSGEIDAENNGLELAFGLNGKQLSTEDREKLEKRAKDVKIEMKETFGTLIRNIIINGGNKSNQIKITSSKRDY